MNNKEQVTTVTRTITREAVKTAISEGLLSVEEELVVRMRYGISLGAGDKLQFRGQDNEETRIKLAMMEMSLLDEADTHQSGSDVISLLED